MVMKIPAIVQDPADTVSAPWVSPPKYSAAVAGEIEPEQARIRF